MACRRVVILLIAAQSCLALGWPALAADYVIHISVDGLRPDFLQTLIDAGQAPNFKRFQDEGAWTNNARTDFTHTNTLPNHTSMVTGRPVLQPTGAPNTLHHGWTLNIDPPTTATLHNSGNLNVAYKASTWDVAHDAGLATSMYASKYKFIIYEQSYNATTGAPHPNGADKITDYFAQENASPAMQTALLAGLANQHFNYSFVHYADADIAGHGFGWGGAEWQTAVKTVDGYLGQLFNLIQTDSMFTGRTAIVLSADHGGAGTEHSTATLATSYTIPFYAWGAGVAHGDLYALNNGVRTDPGTGRPDYNAAGQPIRNGDGGNLALALLGLGAIPGSLINASQDLRVATPGDFNADGTVDGADLSVWRTGFGATLGAAHLEGDADGDHGVDGADFLVWQQHWNGGAAATVVSEPGTLSAAACLVAALAASRRRR